MNRLLHRSRKFSLLLITSLVLTSLLAACANDGQETKSQPTTSVTFESTAVPTNTVQPPTPTPLPPTPTPVQEVVTSGEDDSARLDAGVFVLAMGDGKHQHLFAYHPVNLPLTRITGGEYDYSDPAISPDGTRIALCANPSGNWEIHVLNLLTTEQVQVTETGSYACAPSWSPDGLWLAYETLINDKLTVMLKSTVDDTTPPMQLTDNLGNNFDPAWSPGGRVIAFVTDRNGKLEIWQADLNAVENRLAPLLVSDEANYSAPAWSMDGTSLMWSKTTDQPMIERRNIGEGSPETITLGTGLIPAWATDKLGVAAILRAPNGYELVSYRSDPTRLLFPAIHLPDRVTSLTWQSGNFVANVDSYLKLSVSTAPGPLFEPEASSPDENTGLFNRIFIEDLEAPETYLSDTVNDRFTAMRDQLNAELGWDFLGILQSASTPLPTDTQMDIRGDWLYTGRAIAVNLDPLDAGWMMASREDYNGRTYWRIWLKCMQQDGTCGIPLKEPVWDFSVRYNGDSTAYENGGETGAVPNGYWLDFTAFALRYGWERLPAQSTWRNYFPATNINLFTITDGLTWQQGMLQRYTPQLLEGFLP